MTPRMIFAAALVTGGGLLLGLTVAASVAGVVLGVLNDGRMLGVFVPLLVMSLVAMATLLWLWRKRWNRALEEMFAESRRRREAQ